MDGWTRTSDWVVLDLLAFLELMVHGVGVRRRSRGRRRIKRALRADVSCGRGCSDEELERTHVCREGAGALFTPALLW